MSIRRSYHSIYGLLFVGIFIVSGVWYLENVSIPYIIIGLLYLIIFIGNIRHRNILTLTDGEITVFYGYRKRRIQQENIEFTRVEYSPFAQSYFQLKNGKKIRFNAWEIRQVDYEKLKQINPNIR